MSIMMDACAAAAPRSASASAARRCVMAAVSAAMRARRWDSWSVDSCNRAFTFASQGREG